MKLILILSLVFLNFNKSVAQKKVPDRCFSELQKIIQKNIPGNEDQYSNNHSEYFIIDIKLNDKKDSIANIDFFRKDNSIHYPHVQNLIGIIKSGWKPVKCKYNRIIIPLFLLFSSADDLYDYPIPFRGNENTKFPSDTYIFGEVVIRIHSAIK